jgi:hypothetical protein
MAFLPLFPQIAARRCCAGFAIIIAQKCFAGGMCFAVAVQYGEASHRLARKIIDLELIRSCNSPIVHLWLSSVRQALRAYQFEKRHRSVASKFAPAV